MSCSDWVSQMLKRGYRPLEVAHAFRRSFSRFQKHFAKYAGNCQHALQNAYVSMHVESCISPIHVNARRIQGVHVCIEKVSLHAQ